MPKPTVLRCDPELFEKDLTGRIAIVTGANSGIGLEIARQLSSQGAHVVVACRNRDRGTDASKEIGDGSFLAPLDLASLQSVRAFCDSFLGAYDRLDILVNNAGVMMCPGSKTEDGFETQLGVNHLGHFLLMRLLTPVLVATARSTGRPSRFVALSSVAAAECGMNGKHGAPSIGFEDPMFETRPYDEGVAYGQSKLANYLHALEASRRIPADQLVSTSNHPGWVYTPLDKHVAAKVLGTNPVSEFLAEGLRRFFLWTGHMIQPVDGAQTTLHCVLDESVESGRFYSQFGIYKDEAFKPGGWPMERMPNPNATEEAAEKLWELSEKLVGLSGSDTQ
ncbi:unnamed protein product [Pseudo-nitzschia multistriata]|uniref:Uncharacterized protein n=1 Tax=Pseudo-nitzschia multistriata TaxID=183589 RepID=A0A448ZMN1_9STRA|nr:unnamed protein product [Pseudo-nitzschia multistriata]